MLPKVSRMLIRMKDEMLISDKVRVKMEFVVPQGNFTRVESAGICHFVTYLHLLF